MLELLRVYQLNIMMILSGICGTLAFFVLITKSLSKKRKNALLGIELGSMFLLIMDRYAYVYRGNVSSLGYYMVRISNFFVFATTLYLIYMFNLYLKDLYVTDANVQRLPKRLKVIDGLLIIGFLLVVANLFIGFYYTFDETNHYQRTYGFAVCYIIPIIVLALQLSTIVQNYNKLRKFVRISLLLFALFPLIASFVQFFTYGLSLTNITLVGMAVLLYIFSLLDMNHEIERARNLEIEFLKEEQKNTRMVFEQTALALAGAIDAKDKYTHGHSMRVAEYSRKIAKAAGKDDRDCQEIYYAALLHDVGKIGIPDNIINKEGRLTDEEFGKIKAHPVIGKRILSSINKMPNLSIGANYHHERYDGKGYPEGLKGNDIPDIARVIAVADAYDAMSSKRSYRDPLPQQKVREELVKGSGTQFDPEYAKLMLHLIDLDTEYYMQEREDVDQLTGNNKIVCDSYRSSVSEGQIINSYQLHIRLRCRNTEDAVDGSRCIPTLIFFDSLDGRAYDTEAKKRELMYFEYAEMRPDGTYNCLGARKIVMKKIAQEAVLKSFNRSKDDEYEVVAVKFDDHVKVRLISEEEIYEAVMALPDSARYAYMGITGENCEIVIEDAKRADTPIEEQYITRIAKKISYIDGPEGDLPNLQINGWRLDATPGIPVTDGLTVTFHAMSLPTARLVWHCPSFTVFYSDDGKVNGKNYREFCLIRMDGESWETDTCVDNKIKVYKTDAFEDWDTWKRKNKEGADCKISVKRSGNTIELCTFNNGIDIKNVTTVNDDGINTIYLAITGDQCAITNIKVNPAQK